ncbi:MAG: hypothetical protein RI993_1345 [Pseudomonadota bacterium]|jgi:glucokinase
MSPTLICGDIGGTKTLLRAVTAQDNIFNHLLDRRYDSRAYVHFDEVLHDFLQHLSVAPEVICLAIAGPVTAQQVTLTNLNWHINAQHIQQRFSIPLVRIMNDFEAVAHSIETLSHDDLATLQTGSPQPDATRVVLGAGTGMGVAWLVNCVNGTTILATEAGHIDFAPANTLQIALFDYLKIRYGHVSVERILSGQGLVDLFHFLQKYTPEPGQINDRQPAVNEAAMVTRLAFEQQNPTALQALEQRDLWRLCGQSGAGGAMPWRSLHCRRYCTPHSAKPAATRLYQCLPKQRAIPYPDANDSGLCHYP